MNVSIDHHALEVASKLLRLASEGQPLSLRIRADAMDLSSYLAGVAADDVTRSPEPTTNYAAAAEVEGWAGASPARPSGEDGYEHAFNGETSLCVLPGHALLVFRHQFRAGRLDTCPDCQARAL